LAIIGIPRQNDNSIPRWENCQRVNHTKMSVNYLQDVWNAQNNITTPVVLKTKIAHLPANYKGCKIYKQIKNKRTLKENVLQYWCSDALQICVYILFYFIVVSRPLQGNVFGVINYALDKKKTTL